MAEREEGRGSNCEGKQRGLICLGNETLGSGIIGSNYISDGIRFHCHGLKDARYSGLEEFMAHIGQDINHFGKPMQFLLLTNKQSEIFKYLPTKLGRK